MKKGISPLVATVLIVCLTVILAVIIIVWSSAFVKNVQENTDRIRDEQFACITEVSFNIKKACYNNGGLETVLENTGQKTITKMIIIGQTGSGSQNMQLGLNPTLQPMEVQTYHIPIPALNYASLTPIINLKSKEVICSGAKATKGEIGSAETFQNC
ncbi:hypothetical protein HY643_02715 [Candidatus Woesearchaeota archaeon]|nr:hypothetical protein [Candidatus Woesearchaeota archaeon]